MSQNLEQYLNSGERIIVRARYSVLASIVLEGILFFVMFLFIRIIDSTFDDYTDPFAILVVFVIFLPPSVKLLRSRSVLLTNRRLFFQHGNLTANIEQVSIDDIQSVAYRSTPEAPWCEIAVEHGVGEKLRIFGVPKCATLARAIAAEAALPLNGTDPQALKFDAVLSVTGLFFGLVLFIVAVGYGYSVVIALEDHYFEFAADHLLASAVGIFVGLIISLPPLVIFFALLGISIVYAVGLLILRFTMSAEQMQQLVCVGYSPAGKTLYARYARYSCRVAARYASWLYGRKIRCD